MNKLILSLAVIGTVVFSASGLGTHSFVDNKSKENRYCDSGEGIEKSEIIMYDHKETTYSYNIPSGVPAYLPASGINNNCANIAGTVVIGYYDRFCEQLIPNYSTYIRLGNSIIYRNNTATAVANVMTTLYDLMGTNTGGAGTTFQGYQNGISTYVQNCGYTYSSESVMSGANFDLNKYSTAITSTKPVSIFLTNYSFYIKTETEDGTDKIFYRYSTVGHVVVGYGYYVETYYDSANQVITSRTYLHVAGGQVGSQTCYLCLDSKSTIYTAISATIS